PEQIEAIREAYGLDQPLLSQYLHWLGGLVRFDLGDSLLTGTPIASELAEKLAVTIPLCLLGLTVAIVLGVPAGVYAGLHHRRPGGVSVSAGAQALAAVPVLWAGLLLVVLLGKGVGLVPVLPSQGFPLDGWAEPGKALSSLVLPALTIGIVEGAVILRFVRSAILEALPQDYIRTAAAAGLTRTQAVLRHGLPNASLAVLSVIALQAASLVTGAVLVEALFALPGMGRMLATDVGQRDLVKVQSEVLLLTGLVLLIGLVVDIVHRVIDPRQRRTA
ncbi:MAG: ABC transporter permease, partial [Cellulomonadaceae bacterium]|nr:ABC transporter permease [Cellulomonadaceae bacterium]